MRSFHDFNIYEYMVNCSLSEITLNLQMHHGDEKGTVIFNGVVGHSFEHVLEGNIVSSFGEYGIAQFYEKFAHDLREYQRWGLPLQFKNLAEFEVESNRKKLKFIVISSSYGLSGWIICTQIKIA